MLLIWLFSVMLWVQVRLGGVERHHSDYEDYVNKQTSNYSSPFNVYLSFDGRLDTVSAYDAAKNLAYDTTFDVDGELTCMYV